MTYIEFSYKDSKGHVNKLAFDRDDVAEQLFNDIVDAKANNKSILVVQNTSNKMIITPNDIQHLELKKMETPNDF